MKTQEYNGWTNYETWLVKLWMDNDEGSSNYWQEAARDIFDSCTPSTFKTRSQAARYDLSDALRERHEGFIYESLPESLHASFIMDLLNGALSDVNWQEIANSLLNSHVEDYEPRQEEAVA